LIGKLAGTEALGLTRFDETAQHDDGES